MIDKPRFSNSHDDSQYIAINGWLWFWWHSVVVGWFWRGDSQKMILKKIFLIDDSQYVAFDK